MSTDIKELQKILVDLKASLLSEGFLNNRFIETQQNMGNQDSMFELLTLFLEDTTRVLDELHVAIVDNGVHVEEVAAHFLKIEESSLTFGAQRLTNVCTAFRHNLEVCLKCLNQVKEEYNLVKEKLERLVSLENQIRQIVEAGGSAPKDE